MTRIASCDSDCVTGSLAAGLGWLCHARLLPDGRLVRNLDHMHEHCSLCVTVCVRICACIWRRGVLQVHPSVLDPTTFHTRAPARGRELDRVPLCAALRPSVFGPTGPLGIVHVQVVSDRVAERTSDARPATQGSAAGGSECRSGPTSD